MTLKILWLSDRWVGFSAYSKQTAEACLRLGALGHQVAHIPMGRANRMGQYVDQGIMIYPSGNDAFAEDVAVDHYVDWKADMLITLKESWVFQHIHRQAINLVLYCPIDHSPVSSAITSRMGTAFRVITPSRFGQRELRRAGVEATYMPHGIRCDVFKPLEDRAAARKAFHFDPDEFVVGIVCMNRARKTIDRMLRGYKLFTEHNPDVKSRLMTWTNVRASAIPEETPAGVADVGVSLLPEIMKLDLGEAVRWPEVKAITKGIPDHAEGPDEWDMNKLYNCFDVLLHCTGGEGAGLPLLEAQSCGVPIVATDYTAMPEHVGAGLTVPANDYMVVSTPGVRYALADIDKMADALTRIMNANPEKLARKARSFAERFDWPTVMERFWVPFLDDAETELRPLVTKEGVKSW